MIRKREKKKRCSEIIRNREHITGDRGQVERSAEKRGTGRDSWGARRVGIIAHLTRRASENNVENCFAVFLSRFQGRRSACGVDGCFVCFPSITRTFSPRGYRACPFLRAVHPARLQSRRIIESAASRPTGLGCTRGWLDTRLRFVHFIAERCKNLFERDAFVRNFFKKCRTTRSPIHGPVFALRY